MQLKQLLSFILIIAFVSVSQAQYSIHGEFLPLAGQEVRLMGFSGMSTYTIDKIAASDKGVFHLSYTAADSGMGYLTAEDNKPLFVVLAPEKIRLKGEILSVPESVTILEGQQNQAFAQYATDHRKREQALSAWVYLNKIYQSDSLFSIQSRPLEAIAEEMKRIRQEDLAFLNGLDRGSYVHWFLPVRKMVSAVSTVAQYRTEEIPQTLAAFRAMDYADIRLYKSGLLKEAIESHYWLLENMGKPLDSVFIEMNISTDHYLTSLENDEKKYNELSKFLFDLMERRSLFKAAEYLAIKSLTQNSCTLTDDFAKQLESYRSLKVGNIAPEITFTGDVYQGGVLQKAGSKLSDIKSDYTVLVFGASWCPKCSEEMAQLLLKYEKWQTKGLEVAFVSLDTEKEVFKAYTSVFPFVSMCDYQKWNSQAARDYAIYGTPTFFLLDKEKKIVLRPGSVKQIDGWVDWKLEE